MLALFSVLLFTAIGTGTAVLCSAPDTGALSSSSAAYDGNALVLSGEVVLDHGLGKMRAEEASLQKQESGKEFPFSSILLRKNVQLELHDHAQLLCAIADLDFVQLKGKLSSLDQERVTYTDQLRSNGHTDSSLRLVSQTVNLEFEKLEHPDQRSDFSIREILASGDVVVDYARIFTLRSANAIYRKPTTSSNIAQGTLLAFPSEHFSVCQIAHEDDLIDAQKIEMDLARMAVFVQKPQGVLASSLVSRSQNGELRFSCDHLLWDHPKNTLELQGDIHIEEDAFGQLNADRKVIMVQNVDRGHRSVSSLHASGHTTIQMQASGKGNVQKLVCHGEMGFDQQHMQAFFHSPTVEGEVLQEQQLYYEENQISLYADRGTIDYALVKGQVQPSAISLKGHIRLMSCDASKSPRCGLADWVTYSPTTRTFILGAHPGRKVLFWDEQEDLRISAQEIHLTRDTGDGPETVKGVGNVQFCFTADEEVLIEKVFRLVTLP